MTESILDEFRGAAFKDQRLSKRLLTITEELAEKPTMSIPAATKGRAEMEATYRFFDNDKVSPKAISAPHCEATIERIRKCDVVIMAQDTTELDLTRPASQVVGTGPLSSESRVGIHYHPLIAFSEQSVALGTVWSKSWVRESIDSELTAKEKDKLRRATPIENKESIRWLEGIREARKVAQACPETECICVADSEADIYELFAEPLTTKEGQLHLIIRGCHDRSVKNQHAHLLDTVRATPKLYECTLNIGKRVAKTSLNELKKRKASRDARTVQCEVRATTITLKASFRPDRKMPDITLNVVLIEESNPPEGETAIQWILLTTLPIATEEQIKKIVACYCIRWQIEIYFKTLKSGCRIEERYFERSGRLLNCLAIYAIIAWKILYLVQLSRDCPDASCEIIFEASEWKSVYLIVKGKLPSTPPSLNEMVRMIASLGGYVIRKTNEPGTQTLWLGMQRLHDMSTAYETFGPK